MTITHTDCFNLLACPVCAEPLHQSGRALSCPNHHSFDLAREGYVNLLPSGHGQSGITGDSIEMVDARRRVFARGHFAPLAQRLAAAADMPTRTTVLDAGCGTGYYLASLREHANEGTCFLGADVSKEAIRRAARDHSGIVFFLNDIKHRLSVQSESIDLLLNIFAPRNPQEFARVLSPGGLLLVVIPNEQHLRELRTRFELLEITERKMDRTVEQLAPAFQLDAAEEVEYRVVLQHGDVGDLLRMTPNYWHLPADVLGKADRMEAMEVTMSVRVLEFRKG